MHHKKKKHPPEEEKGIPFSEQAQQEKETPLDEAPEPSDAEKFAALNEKYVRLLAEYDNYRKRKDKETSEIFRSATEGLLLELLTVIDNLDRATEHRNKSETLEDYVRGIALIEDQLRGVLSRLGVEAMDVVGKEFDPVYHDAIMQIESGEYKPGTIAAEVEKGYTLNGKVIRHPKVVVAKAPFSEKN